MPIAPNIGTGLRRIQVVQICVLNVSRGAKMHGIDEGPEKLLRQSLFGATKTAGISRITPVVTEEQQRRIDKREHQSPQQQIAAEGKKKRPDKSYLRLSLNHLALD